jgi:DNA-binding MarR family transcriptional regulator
MAEPKPGVNPLFLREEELRQGMELLFFAYRDFTGDADTVLAALGFGRAHHRALHFVGRHPGVTVTDLLTILRITKQSLSRVLGDLLREDYISQTQGAADRRQRLLRLTPKGEALERSVSEPQRQRIAAAYRNAGAEAVEGFRKVMIGMIDETDRTRFDGVVSPRGVAPHPSPLAPHWGRGPRTP